MKSSYVKAAAPALLACFALAFAPSGQDEKIVVKRAAPAPTTMKFRVVHAEFYKVEGEPSLDFNKHGEVVLQATVKPGAAAGALEITDMKYLSLALQSQRDAEAKPYESHGLAGVGIARTDGKPTVVAGPAGALTDAPSGFPLGSDWFDLSIDAAHRLESAASCASALHANHARLTLALPALPADPIAKDGRFDADFIAGYLGNEGQLQVFYASVLKSFDDKTATFQHSGKPKIVMFPAAASRPAKPVSIKIDDEKSYYSASVTVSRVDGAVEKREGEFFVKAAVAVGDQPAKTVTGKIWTKVERLP